MALYAFDGTGNEDKPDNEDGGFDSNVLSFFRAYQDPLKNFDDSTTKRGSLYLKGIGERARTLLGHGIGEAFGIGGHRRVRQMIDRLEDNVEAGDSIVDVIGFSRGAALALSFANEIASKVSQVTIRFMGLWDIVGEFGAPGRFVNAGHDLHMPPNVQHCYHAMSLDERRLFFQLTRLSPHRPGGLSEPVEVWFRGVHSDVGGGNGNFGLNWIALHWMYENARRHGLDISQTAVDENRKHKGLATNIKKHKVAEGPERRILATDLLHASVGLDPADISRQRNDPKIPLARIDDAGVTTPVPAK